MMPVRLDIKSIIDAKGWSISEFQRNTRLSYPTAFKLYHGQARRVDFDTLGQVLDALGVKVEDILIHTPAEKNTTATQ